MHGNAVRARILRIRLFLIGDVGIGPESSQFSEYLTIERSRGRAPVIVDGASEYNFATDEGPNRLVIGFFEGDVSAGPMDFIDVGIN